jgi:hypothetical protein
MAHIRKDRGSSMVFTLLILFAILALGVAGLSGATSGLTLANNYRTGLQAEQAAESGLVHAVRAINGYGVRDFTVDVAPQNNWNAIFGSSAVQMPGYSTINYAVSPLANPAATSTTMWVAAVGQAPGESTRTISARLGLTQPFTCGAIDLPSEGVSSNFIGNNFSVDGRDYAIGAVTPISGATPTLGISTRTQTDADNVEGALNGAQQDNVDGTAVPNQVASIGPCVGPDVDRIRNTIVPTMLSQPSPPVVTSQAGMVNGNQTFGTVDAPQITYFNGDTSLNANGNSSGAGIMIVDGSLTLSGSLEFTGLIIVIGETDITGVTGNATVYGALWTTDLSLSVGGSAAVRYSTESLTLANSIPGVQQQLLPRKVDVLAWSQG